MIGAPDLRYKEIVRIIDAAHGAGVRRVGIVTEGMRKAAECSVASEWEQTKTGWSWLAPLARIGSTHVCAEGARPGYQPPGRPAGPLRAGRIAPRIHGLPCGSAF